MNEEWEGSKVLYIAGYGRSGSTVLDVVLGNHPDMVSVGELTYLADDWSDPDRSCACGAPYVHCDFWNDLSDVVSFPSEDTASVVRAVERRRSTLPVLFDLLDAEAKEQYRATQQRLFRYITEVSDKSIVVDSSKSAGDAAMRFYALSELAGLDVYVLHLVRDGLSTVASCVRKGSNWALEGHRPPPAMPGLRAAVGWTVANLWTMMLARRYFPRDRYLRVHFEDLIADPACTLERIGAFVGVDVDVLIDRIECNDAFDVGHNVGGNRVRMKKKIQLETQNENCRKDRRLPWSQRLAFTMIGGWLDSYLSSP